MLLKPIPKHGSCLFVRSFVCVLLYNVLHVALVHFATQAYAALDASVLLRLHRCDRRALPQRRLRAERSAEESPERLKLGPNSGSLGDRVLLKAAMFFSGSPN